MEIVKIPIDELTMYKKNAKLHPREQIEQIKQSIKMYGNNDPIGIWGNNNQIVEGNGRYIAMKELGFTECGWIWNNDSTMTSQIIDTVLFIGISFGIGFGWFFNKKMHAPLFAMMIGQYLLKFILAAIDTPFFYFLTRRREQNETAN